MIPINNIERKKKTNLSKELKIISMKRYHQLLLDSKEEDKNDYCTLSIYQSQVIHAFVAF